MVVQNQSASHYPQANAGTKDLVVILPVSETAKAISASTKKTVKALAFAGINDMSQTDMEIINIMTEK